MLTAITFAWTWLPVLPVPVIVLPTKSFRFVEVVYVAALPVAIVELNTSSTFIKS